MTQCGCDKHSDNPGEPARYGYTTEVPGFGFLRDQFPEPFKVSWDIADGWATSADLPRGAHPGRAVHGHHRSVPGAQAARRHYGPRPSAARPRRLCGGFMKTIAMLSRSLLQGKMRLVHQAALTVLICAVAPTAW